MVSLSKTLNYLFVSKVRIKCLKYFFQNQDVPIHLRGASRELSEEINAVRRELMRLTEIKLVKMDSRGNRKYFVLNTEFPFFEELSGIFFKTTGLGEELLKNQATLGTIYFAAFTSSYVSGVKLGEGEIDFLVIGDVDLEMINAMVQKEEDRTGKQIQYTVLKLAEFNLRKKRKDPFIFKLLLNTKILLLGNREEYVN